MVVEKKESQRNLCVCIDYSARMYMCVRLYCGADSNEIVAGVLELKCLLKLVECMHSRFNFCIRAIVSYRTNIYN